MTKADFIAKIADASGASKAQTAKIVDSTFEVLTDVLAGDDSINIKGFGTFSTAVQKGREGKNPMNGKPYKTKDKNVAKFKAGCQLAEKVAPIKKKK